MLIAGRSVDRIGQAVWGRILTMTDSRETVRDKLGDPASWPSVPDGFSPPNESYLLARLASVYCAGRDVVIVIKVGGHLFLNTFEMESDSEAELIVARIQHRAGDLLLEAIEAEL